MRATTVTAIFFAAIAAALALLQAPADSDMFWQLTSGEWILDHRALLDHDIWSFTRDGSSYAVGAWLGQVALAAVYRAGGWLGVDVLRALLVGVAALFTARCVLRFQPHPGWAALPVLGTVLVTRMVWGDRPQLFTLALFPVVLDLLFAARFEGRGGRLVLLPPLFLLWANLHNAFVIGLVAVAVFAAEAVVTRARIRTAMLAAAAASLLAAQLNPSGGGAIGRAAAYAAVLPGWIVEERALDILSGPGLVFAFLLVAALAAALVRGREGIAERPGATLLWPVLITPFALLALAIQRDTPYACMVLAPLAATLVPAALGRPALRVPVLPRVAGVGVIVLIALALSFEAAAVAPRAPDLSAYPAGALPELREHPGNLLNEYDWGGYLIRYAAEHPVFIDGRGAVLFVPDVLDDFKRAVALRPGYRAVLQRWDIALVLLRPDRPLVGALREDGWRVLASEDAWILLGR